MHLKFRQILYRLTLERSESLSDDVIHGNSCYGWTGERSVIIRPGQNVFLGSQHEIKIDPVYFLL